MLLPIRTSIYPRRTPYANYFLIAANIVVFMLSMTAAYDPQTGQRGLVLRNWAEPFMLTPQYPFIWQFISYAFLHSSIMHIFGNMYFLYIFGNNVNDKLGNVGYLCFYLAGAVFSGLGHTLLSSTPVLGASGAVAAVTGAYLVLFPNTLITVIYWLFFIGTVEIRALYFIAFKLIIYDNVLEPKFSHAPVAYDAHIAGYLSGIAMILALLSLRIIQPDFNDLWSMIRQWNRRRQFKDAVSDGYNPQQGTRFKHVASKVSHAKSDSPEQEKIAQLRSDISRAVSNRSVGQAAQYYRQLMAIDDSQVLPRQLQLDIANQLMAESQWAQSAHAYEGFLAQYPDYEFAEQVHLMLGLVYGRYLKRPKDALVQLHRAEPRLSDPGQKNLCRQEIERLEKT